MKKQILTSAVISILALISLSACSNSSLPPEQQLVSSAMNKSIAGKLEAAMVDLNKAIEINPAYSDAYLVRGMTTLEIGKEQTKGMADLDKSIQLSPTVPDGYFQKGIYQMAGKLGTLQEACANFSKAAALGMSEAKELFGQNCQKATDTPAPTEIPTSTDNSISVDQPFTLKLGSSAIFQPAGVTVQFAEVKSDSRCPSDVTCIWAGEATVHVKITTQGPTVEADLVIPGSDKDTIEVRGDVGAPHNLKLLDLKPYPNSKTPATNDQYIATFQLNLAK